MNQPQGRSRLTRSAVLIAALLFALLLTTAALAQAPTPPRIVGGQEADPGEWPWQVALVGKGNDSLFNLQFCGGTIIAADWVLTAAHCVDTSTINQLDIVAGVHDLSNPGPNIQRRTLSQIIVHPGWDDDTFDNDIALLRLSSPIAERPASAGVLPIQYAPLVPANIGDLAGQNVTVTGWGNRQPNPPGGINDFPPRLHEVVVPVVTNAACAARYVLDDITANMLCAGPENGGKDACQGDSGGPLVYNNNGTWQLAGVVSWGRGCADPQYYGVYTRVSRYLNWISSHTNPFVGTEAIFFPIVMAGTAAPPPPPPPPPPPGSSIVNGNFEAGPGVGWDEESANDFDLILSTSSLPDPFPTDPHSGDWGAWLGGGESEISIISQRVVVSAATPVLSFYYWIDSGDFCGYDFADVYANGTAVWSRELCAGTSMEDWARATVSLSMYAGQEVLLQFVVDSDESFYSSMLVDDVSLVPVTALTAEEETARPAPLGPGPTAARWMRSSR